MYNYNLWLNFLVNKIRCFIAYRDSFFASLVNIIIKSMATGMLWITLYSIGGIDVEFSLHQMLLYAIASISLSQCLTWWDGPHLYALNIVKTGKIITEMLRPVPYPMIILLRGSTEFAVNFIIYSVPTFLFGLIFFKIQVHINIIQFTWFIISFLLSYLVMFLFQMFLAIVSILTLELSGILHFFHAVIMLLSCQYIPLWMYPQSIQNLIQLLPFQYVFYTPLSILTSQIDWLSFVQTTAVELLWIIILVIINFSVWKYAKTKVCIQGG